MNGWIAEQDGQLIHVGYIEVPFQCGMFHLECCAFFFKVAVTQQLVERGADPDRVNVLSKTAFELAMQLKQRDIKAYLDSITTVRPQTGEAASSLTNLNLLNRRDND